jgi:ornithine cyclodeaminase
MRVLNDADVAEVPAAEVVSAARNALLKLGNAELIAPPRIQTNVGAIQYVFTVGGVVNGCSGFRVYRAGEPAGDQLVVVWNASGILAGLVIGDELGARRTGALGAVAADVLARPDANMVAVVGTGHQAWTQLWALQAVRKLKRVFVYSPSRQHREDFAARVHRDLRGIEEVLPTLDAGAAVREADIVILATRSTTPVIAAEDVRPGTHVTTIGPKTVDGHETPLELVEAAAVVACDSPAQAVAYGRPFFTGSAQLISLADVLLGKHHGRQHNEDITLYCSAGLAGSEVVIAERMLVDSRP